MTRALIPSSPRPREYARFLEEIEERIRTARLKALASLNEQMMRLYWQIGRGIAERQERAGWGDAVIDRLASDLRRAFPGSHGFSRTNLFNMRQLYLAYGGPDRNCPTAVGQIPWSHNLLILGRVEGRAARVWYVRQTLSNGWSRNVLSHHLAGHLYERQARALKTHNFGRTLPRPQSDLAREMLLDRAKGRGRR